MPIIEVEGLGKVEIQGNVPTQQEQQAIMQAMQNKLPDPQPRQAGLYQRLDENIRDRIGNMGQAVQRQTLGEQNLAHTGVQLAGEGLGAVGDVLGNLAISGYRALPDVKYGIDEGVGALANIPIGDETLGQRVGSGAISLSEGFADFEESNPVWGATARGLGNIATSLPITRPLKALDAVGSAGRIAGRGTKLAGRQLKDLIPRPEDAVGNKLAQEARKGYKLADELGGVISDTRTSDILQSVKGQAFKDKTGFNPASLKALQKVNDPDGIVRNTMEFLDTLEGQPLNLAGFREIDQSLGSAAYSAKVSDRASAQLIAMQRELRDIVENLGPDDLVGGKEGFEVYKAARELWKKQAKIRDLENITKRAFATDQPTNATKRALNRFLAKDENIRGFTKAEIEAIEQAAETGVVSNMLRLVSSRLPASFALGNDPKLAPVLSTLSSGAQNLSDEITLQNMNAINQLIASGQKPKTSVFGALGAQATDGAQLLGSGVEILYSGGRGRLSTLGTAQQLIEEEQRERQQ